MVASALDNLTDHKTIDNLRYFLSCDWGTSSFRLRLVESTGASERLSPDLKTPEPASLSYERKKTGKMNSEESTTSARIIAAISNEQGIKKVHNRWSEPENPQNRIAYYCSFLKQEINKLLEKCPDSTVSAIAGAPLIISGMASSSIGMQELPYGTLPFSLDQPDTPVEHFEATDHLPHDIYLISGLRSSNDIMRGEETELIGLFSATGISNGLYLLAGTHSKHVIVKNNAVTDFKTYMTGELFDLLSSKSILSNSVSKSKNGPGPAFEKGVLSVLNDNILHELFSIRARDILRQSKPVENYDYLSGLLIGTELKNIRQEQADEIVLAGNNRIQKYYAAALHILDLNFTQIDSLAAGNITPSGHLKILHYLRS